MNHGRCKNCWWWDSGYSMLPTFEAMNGRCYMQGGNITREDSYCSDYVNREKETKKCGETLMDWRKSIKK